MLTFDTFEPGRAMGSHAIAIDEALVGLWHRLYPYDDAGGLMPPGMASVVTMRSYMAILTPRPKGNVHAGQTMQIVRLPRIGERLTTTISCRDKELRKERRLVHFLTETRVADGVLAFHGTTTSIWAA